MTHKAVVAIDTPFTEVGGLLAALGNNETKALLLAAMQPGHVYSRSDLRRLMHERQGQPLIWRLSPSLAFEYCAHSLAPIGLVTQAVLDPADLSTYGYIKTPCGQEKGEALAGHLLHFSESCTAFSLTELLGSTNTVRRIANAEQGQAPTDRGTSFRRYRLLLAIATASLPLRETDLARLLRDTPDKLSPHLHVLSRSGIISYRTTPLGESYVTYRLAPGAPATLAGPDHRAPTLSRQLFALLQEQPAEPRTIDVLLERLLAAYPARVAQDRKVLWQITSRTLSYLERLGVVERGPFRPAVQSEIDLTAKQRAALAPFVAIVQRFTAGDPQFPAEGRRMALQIVWDEKRFRQLLGKAHAASWSANRYRLEDLAKLVVEVLGQRPAATVSSIHAALVEQHGVRVTQQRTSQVVRALKEAGALIVVNADWPLRYSLAT